MLQCAFVTHFSTPFASFKALIMMCNYLFTWSLSADLPW